MVTVGALACPVTFQNNTVVVCDAWEGERAQPERVLRPLADRAARRFYERASATYGGETWEFVRGHRSPHVLAPQICEPGDPNARYVVLCVERDGRAPFFLAKPPFFY